MPIYLDYNATTPVDEQVLQTMLPYFTQKFGNASSSTHQFGWIAKNAVDTARQQVANLIHCEPQEIHFTSGATESINLTIQGIFNAYKTKGNHIVTCQTEHKAVLDTCKYLETKGANISYLSVNKNGIIDLNELENTITENTILVAIMLANNETGVIQPIEKIAKIVHQKNSILFCDATQAIGKLPINIHNLGIDAMCISAHKLYGPKGVGALFLRRKNPRVTIEPLFFGGNHERNIRSGTLNTTGIVGLGKACEMAENEMVENTIKIKFLRDYLENELAKITTIIINGFHTERLYNTSNITFNITAEKIINATKTKLAIATGSACTSIDNLPSHVLTAMKISAKNTKNTIRFSLGKYTTKQEIDEVISIFREIFKM